MPMPKVDLEMIPSPKIGEHVEEGMESPVVGEEANAGEGEGGM